MTREPRPALVDHGARSYGEQPEWMLKRIRALLGRRGPKDAAETRAASEPDSRPGPRPPVHHGPAIVHRPIAETDLDADAVKIVRRLTRFDHKAYFVGGCVRDLLLDRKPKDFDVGTSATPRQIKRLFRNCRIIGRRFRLAHIYFQNGKIIEVATFRSRESQGGDDEDLLIRDDNVFGTPEEDALRRDFTINSLFYDVGDGNVLDHTDGLGDLRRKLVRTIGDPDVRFREDPIRILRAIKFAARLDFSIESKTLESLRRLRHEVDKAAMPRVLEEINRFCRGGAARRSFEVLGETEVFEVVFPEVAKAYARDEAAWGLMLDLLARMDTTRASNGREIRTGEIFTTVLLPLLVQSFGWNRAGTAERPRGLNVRRVIDDLLRPLALRLRIPRREQEHCRQVLGTLFRMVPARRIRKNTRQAILARECLPDAIWVLESLADRFGGDFTEAHTYWTTGREQSTPSDQAPATGSRSRRGRKRGRRRPASSRSTPAAAERREAPTSSAQAQDKPAVWDDDYFFAALPSAPEMAGDETKGDRYGAGTVVPTDADATKPEPEADAPPKPKRKRRRRRRRGGAPRKDATAESDETTEDSGSGEPTATD